jgi:hypothetical protein
MIKTEQATIVKDIRNRKAVEAKKILERTRAIRTQITEKSGKWDAVEALRTLRYAR